MIGDVAGDDCDVGVVLAGEGGGDDGGRFGGFEGRVEEGEAGAGFEEELAGCCAYAAWMVGQIGVSMQLVLLRAYRVRR